MIELPGGFLDSFLRIARVVSGHFPSPISSSVRGARCTGDGVHVWGGRWVLHLVSHSHPENFVDELGS